MFWRWSRPTRRAEQRTLASFPKAGREYRHHPLLQAEPAAAGARTESSPVRRRSTTLRAPMRSLLLPDLSRAFLRRSQTAAFVTWGVSRSCSLTNFVWTVSPSAIIVRQHTFVPNLDSAEIPDPQTDTVRLLCSLQ